MRTLYCGLIFFLIGFASHVQAWNLAKDKDGVKVFTQDSRFPGFKMFKGEVQISTSLERAIAFLKDVENAKAWLHDCKESKLIQSIDFNHYRVYQVTEAPWPVQDRDYVLDIEVLRSQTKKHAVIKVKGLDRQDLMPLQKKRIRVTDLNGTWTLTETASNSVTIVFETEADPTGKIPAWLANAFVVDQPFNTLLNLKRHFAGQP